MRLRALANAGLLCAALAGCQRDFVLVTFRMPPDLVYTGIRVTKVPHGSTAESRDYPFAGGRASDGDQPHQLDIAVPSDGAPVDVQAQANSDVLFVAEGLTTVKAGQGGVELALVPCSVRVTKDVGGSCVIRPPEVAPPSGGMGDAGQPTAVGPDGGSMPDADPPDVAGDTGPDTQPGTCAPPREPDRSPDEFPEPTDLPPACRRYCAAMMNPAHPGCIYVYRTESRCLYACGALKWSDNSTSQNTLMCRINWAERPSVGNVEREADCRKAAPISIGASNDGVCGDSCGA